MAIHLLVFVKYAFFSHFIVIDCHEFVSANSHNDGNFFTLKTFIILRFRKKPKYLNIDCHALDFAKAQNLIASNHRSFCVFLARNDNSNIDILSE